MTENNVQKVRKTYEEIERRAKDLVEWRDRVLAVVQAQTKLETLWVEPRTAPEAYMQKAIHRLHKVILGQVEPYASKEKPMGPDPVTVRLHVDGREIGTASFAFFPRPGQKVHYSGMEFEALESPQQSLSDVLYLREVVGL